MKKPLIAPSILSADAGKLADEIVAIDEAGADWIHIDVMDGHFVPNLTFGPPVIKALRPHTKRPFDVHLMIDAPERSIDQYADAGADIITIHQEATRHLDRTLHAINELGAKPGVSLNPATPVATVEAVLGLVDVVLVMSVNPGFSGQSFIGYCTDKVRALHAMRERDGLKFQIEVDGGVSPTTAPALLNAGADVLVSGSSVFGASDYTKAIAALRAP